MEMRSLRQRIERQLYMLTAFWCGMAAAYFLVKALRITDGPSEALEEEE